MRILIGTPINNVNDYCLERWLENVSEQEYPADLLLMDSSPDINYMEKVKGYCAKYKLNYIAKFDNKKDSKHGSVYKPRKNYTVRHIEVGEFQPPDEKIGRSREEIRQQFLAGAWDSWFSWECDQIIPPDTLKKLVDIMNRGNYSMVNPNSWGRDAPGEPSANFECCLIRRWCLERYGFNLEYSDTHDNWTGNEVRFKKLVLKGGGNYIQIYGLIGPIYQLRK